MKDINKKTHLHAFDVNVDLVLNQPATHQKPRRSRTDLFAANSTRHFCVHIGIITSAAIERPHAAVASPTWL
jgi:hypothetical protein